MEQVLPSLVKVESRNIQVGAPAFPVGVTIEVGLEITTSKLTQLPDKSWDSEPFVDHKTLRITISAEELEQLWAEYTGEVVDYEVWRETVLRKADQLELEQ